MMDNKFTDNVKEDDAQMIFKATVSGVYVLRGVTSRSKMLIIYERMLLLLNMVIMISLNCWIG